MSSLWLRFRKLYPQVCISSKEIFIIYQPIGLQIFVGTESFRYFIVGVLFIQVSFKLSQILFLFSYVTNGFLFRTAKKGKPRNFDNSKHSNMTNLNSKNNIVLIYFPNNFYNFQMVSMQICKDRPNNGNLIRLLKTCQTFYMMALTMPIFLKYHCFHTVKRPKLETIYYFRMKLFECD